MLVGRMSSVLIGKGVAMKSAANFVALFITIMCAAALFFTGCAPKTVNEVSIEEPPSVEQTQPQPKPTPPPTLQPTPEPTPIPSPGSDFYDEFFNSSVFIGDSITQGLQNYVTKMRKDRPLLLGDANFAAAKSFNLERACKKRVSSDGALRYRGKAMTIPGIINEMGVNTVYIMLGVNDWAGSHIDGSNALYRELLGNIRSECPGVNICIQSCTPVTKSGERDKLNNENLDDFNDSLQVLCEETGAHYVDVSTALKSEDNCLKPEFSSDHYVHVSKEGAIAWVNALYQYAYDAYASGAWTPSNERSQS